MLIGLTGKYCAGKNFIAAILEARGLPVLDVDKLGYQALDAEKEKVFTRFGFDLKLPDGSVDRKLLGKRVFNNPKNLAALEEIVHPVANLLTEEWIAEKGCRKGVEKVTGTYSHLVINAALLHRSSVFNKLDHIIIVKASFFTRLLRAMRRDKLPWIEIFKRFIRQMHFDTQYLAINAEIHIVENSKRTHPGNLSFFKLEKKIDNLLEGIK